MIKTPKTYSGKITEKDAVDIDNLKREYKIYFEFLDESVRDGKISSEEMWKVKEKLAKRYATAVYLIPKINKISSGIESVVNNFIEKHLR
jgi:hypothetical protein